MPTYQPYPIYQPPQNNTVSMPAEALDTIIRAIGRRPADPPHPRVVTRYIRRPTPIYNTRGRGGYRGGYGGRGRGTSLNRRGRRSGRDEETDHNPTAWTINTVTPAPIINAPTAPTADIDLAFLNDFSNTDLASNAGDDIVMVNDAATIEGNDAAVEADVAV
jgi:hypothetical protein